LGRENGQREEQRKEQRERNGGKRKRRITKIYEQ
jgi:hypothetical protein